MDNPETLATLGIKPTLYHNLFKYTYQYTTEAIQTLINHLYRGKCSILMCASLYKCINICKISNCEQTSTINTYVINLCLPADIGNIINFMSYHTTIHQPQCTIAVNDKLIFSSSSVKCKVSDIWNRCCECYSVRTHNIGAFTGSIYSCDRYKVSSFSWSIE